MTAVTAVKWPYRYPRGQTLSSVERASACDVSTGERQGSDGRTVRGALASVKDVAAAAGVSLGTVSNVLNRPERVSAATRERVERAMADLGFVRNESARQLRIGHQPHARLRDARRHQPVLHRRRPGHRAGAPRAPTCRCSSATATTAPTREQAHLAHLLEQQRVQGILLTPIDPDAPCIDAVAGGGVPLVIVDRTRDDDTFCSVAVDDVLGGRLAVEHLLDRGHDRVAFVGGPERSARSATASPGPAQRLGRRRAARRRPHRSVDRRRSTVAEGRGAGERLAGLPAGRRRPTAAFCANDLLALGLLQQAISSGGPVPGDLAIVGLRRHRVRRRRRGAADAPCASPGEELGRTAGRAAALPRQRPEAPPPAGLFQPELVARASTSG